MQKYEQYRFQTISQIGQTNYHVFSVKLNMNDMYIEFHAVNHSQSEKMLIYLSMYGQIVRIT